VKRSTSLTYAITGLSYEPQTIWLDDDLHFFGTPGKWFAVLREGWKAQMISFTHWIVPPKMRATPDFRGN